MYRRDPLTKKRVRSDVAVGVCGIYRGIDITAAGREFLANETRESKTVKVRVKDQIMTVSPLKDAGHMAHFCAESNPERGKPYLEVTRYCLCGLCPGFRVGQKIKSNGAVNAKQMIEHFEESKAVYTDTANGRKMECIKSAHIGILQWVKYVSMNWSFYKYTSSKDLHFLIMKLCVISKLVFLQIHSVFDCGFWCAHFVGKRWSDSVF